MFYPPEEHIYRFRVIYLREMNIAEYVEQEHHQILDAIREGNEKLAAELSEKHIRNQMVSIVEALDHKNYEVEPVQSSKLSRCIYAFLAVGAAGILIIIVLFALKSYADIFTGGKLVFLVVSLALAAAVILAGSRLNWGNGLTDQAFILLTVVLALAPRLFWVLTVDTAPFSDFLHMHNYGIAVTQGDFTNYVDFYSCFPFKFGFGFLVGGLYALFGPAPLVVQLFNVFLSLAQVLLVYLVAREIEPEAARPAALFYAVWPAQIMYCSVVAAENSFLVPFFAAIYVLVVFLKRHAGSPKGYAMLIAAGVLTAVAQAMRPMAMVLIPAAAVLILFFIPRRALEGRSTAKKALFIALTALSYFAALKLVSIPIKELSGVDITRSGSGYNFLVGTNYEANGMFNQEDFSIIAKYDFDFDRVHSEAKKLAIQRIREDPVRFMKLMVKRSISSGARRITAITGAPFRLTAAAGWKDSSSSTPGSFMPVRSCIIW